MNVAFTRAKGKLVVIADREWCAKAMETESNVLLRQLVLQDQSVARMDVLPPAGLRGTTRKPGCVGERLLAEAICRRPQLSGWESGFILRDAGGTPLVSADIAFPARKLAVYVDGSRWSILTGDWRRECRQRRLLVDAGWNFAVFSIGEVHQDPDACAEEIEHLLRAHAGNA